MSLGIILRPVRLTPAQLSVAGATSGVNAAFPVGNLADIQPKTVMQGNFVAGVADFQVGIGIDLGADTSIDTIAYLFTNLSAAGTWLAFANTNAQGPIASETFANQLFGSTAFGVAATAAGSRRHGLWLAAVPISRRYLRIYLTDTVANLERIIRAGVIAVGLRFQPPFDYEYGSGRKADDASAIRQLPGGETAIERGGIVPIWRGTWSNLTEAEWRLFWAMITEAGASSPIIVIEEPDAVAGQPEGIHYGLLTSIDFSERIQLDKQKVDVTIREML